MSRPGPKIPPLSVTDAQRAVLEGWVRRRTTAQALAQRSRIVPRKITDADVERVIVRTLEEKPENATHWSTRSMAAATSMSQSAISRIWRAFALAPHRSQTFKVSTDPLFKRSGLSPVTAVDDEVVQLVRHLGTFDVSGPAPWLCCSGR